MKSKPPVIQIVRNRARKLYTPGATNGQLQYHVRVVAGNNKILVWSETYPQRKSAKAVAQSLLSLGSATSIVEVDETGDK